MKKLMKKNMVASMLMIATLASYGNEGKEKASITTMTFENVKDGSTLTIKDNNGMILYKEMIELNGTYSKGFDLTALPDGNYYFEMDKEVTISIVPFKVVSNQVLFEKENKQVINKPVVVNKDNIVSVSKLSLDNQPLEVAIYYGDDLVKSEKLEGDLSLQRRYDFSTSLKGEYKIITKADGKSFVNYVKI